MTAKAGKFLLCIAVGMKSYPTRAFFHLEKYLPTTVGNATHKFTPASLIEIQVICFPRDRFWFGIKAHETSASWNHAILGYMPEIGTREERIGQNHTKKSTIAQTFGGSLASKDVVAASNPNSLEMRLSQKWFRQLTQDLHVLANLLF